MDPRAAEGTVLAVGLLTARWLVGLSLVLAGAAKLRVGRQRLLAAVLGYELVHPRAASAVARVLPPLELGIGGLLIAGAGTEVAAIAGGALFAIFSTAIAISLLRGKTHPCGCGGDKVTPVQWRLVRRNGAMLILLGPIAVFGGGPLSVDAALTAIDATWPLTTFAASLAIAGAAWAIGGSSLRTRVMIRTLKEAHR